VQRKSSARSQPLARDQAPPENLEARSGRGGRPFVITWREAVVSSDVLTAPDRLVALVLSLRMKPDGGPCWPALGDQEKPGDLMRRTALGERTIRNSLGRLGRTGFLAVTHRPGKTSIYRPTLPGGRQEVPPSEIADDGGRQEVPPVVHLVPPTPAAVAGELVKELGQEVDVDAELLAADFSRRVFPLEQLFGDQPVTAIAEFARDPAAVIDWWHRVRESGGVRRPVGLFMEGLKKGVHRRAVTLAVDSAERWARNAGYLMASEDAEVVLGGFGLSEDELTLLRALLDELRRERAVGDGGAR
jgi:hypothetical protein